MVLLGVMLTDDKGSEPFLYHRFVASECKANSFNQRCIDHVDHDTTDNCITNLRWVRHGKNHMNSTTSANTSSKYKGGLTSEAIYCMACVFTEDKYATCLASFKNEEEAARACNDKALEIFGEYASKHETHDADVDKLIAANDG